MSCLSRPLRALCLLAIAGVVVMGCATGPEPRLTPYLAQDRPTDAPAPAPLRAGPAPRSNASIASDFYALLFEAEGGLRYDALNKLDQPIGVLLETERFDSHRPFLRDFLAELREAAGIDIALAASPQEASRFASRIHIRFVSFGEMDAATPNAQCIFLPGVEPFWRLVDQPGLYRDLSRQIAAQDTTIYIPVDRTPSDVRECFYEEITQALGPRNDLLHLSGSIFNDENAHVRPTRFDLLILKALYDPRLRPRDRRAAVERALPRVLEEINPIGELREGQPLTRLPRLDDLYRESLEARRRRSDRETSLDAARTLAADLPAYDYRRVLFDAVAARLSRRVEDETFASLAARYETAALDDPLRAALMRRYQVRELAQKEDWDEIRRIGPALIAPLARAGRDADVAVIVCLVARAEVDAAQRDRARRQARACLQWSAYAFGGDHRFTRRMTTALEDLL